MDTLDAVIAQIRVWEGCVNHMYLDSAVIPNVTIGIGCLLATADAAAQLLFRVAALGVDRRATPDEIRADFCRVKALPGGLQAARYAASSGSPVVYLPEAEIAALARQRLSHAQDGLTSLFPAFENLPQAVQEVLFDLAWNLGLAGLEKFGHLRAAVLRHDWQAASIATHVRTSRSARNDWRRLTMLQASHQD
jgi:GH24 family phage-related lysozyme (muramidase)